nr:nuclear RNA export factor 3-like [Loxodonta africana]
MSDAHMGPGVRYTPYAIPSYYQRGSCHRRDQTHGNMERDRKPPQEGMQGNRQYGTSRSWFKVTIPFGIKYDEKWLLDLIQSQCSVPFNPIEFHYEKMQAQFFVENASIALELKKVSGKIRDEENETISIFVSPSAVPPSVQKELKSETVKLPNVMQTQDMTCTHTQIHCVAKNNGYEVPEQGLVLRRVHSDPSMTDRSNSRAGLRSNAEGEGGTDGVEGTFVPDITSRTFSLTLPSSQLLSFNSSYNIPSLLVGLPDVMQKAPNIRSLSLSKNEAKSEGELDKVKELEPEEMFADRNPLCTTFPDTSTNINSILEMFPKLLSLDGHEVHPPIIFGKEAYKKLPACKGSVFGSETLKNLVLQFLQHYYWIYDYGDRRGLLDAYHNEACFSLAIPFNPEDLVPNSLEKYSKGSRNMRKLKDPVLRVQLLKHTKRDIVESLSVLPKTQHDVSSLVVDMCVQTEMILCFSVSGVFKEVEGMSQAHVRAFTRIFIATPSSNFR